MRATPAAASGASEGRRQLQVAGPEVVAGHGVHEVVSGLAAVQHPSYGSLVADVEGDLVNSRSAGHGGSAGRRATAVTVWPSVARRGTRRRPTNPGAPITVRCTVLPTGPVAALFPEPGIGPHGNTGADSHVRSSTSASAAGPGDETPPMSAHSPSPATAAHPAYRRSPPSERQPPPSPGSTSHVPRRRRTHGRRARAARRA